MTVGAADDVAERNADDVADAVVGSLARRPASGHAVAPAAPRIRRSSLAPPAAPVAAREVAARPGTRRPPTTTSPTTTPVVAEASTAVRIQRSPEIIRRDTDLSDEQQAQYMDLGPDLGDYAVRTAPKTKASEGGIVEALAVLPRNPDGSLTAPAMAMIEAFEKGQWDTNYEKWMTQTMPAPARKTWLFVKESDKAYQQRIAAAAKKMDTSMNSVTGRSKNPELANLQSSNGQPDAVVAENVDFSGVTVTVRSNSSDVNAAERKGMIGGAIAKIVAAGGTIGAGLQFNLPKYGRELSVNGDCTVLNVSNFGTRAVFVAPKYVHLSSEILGNPNEATETSTGEKRMNYLSAALDPEGTASIVHELGHYCHYRHSPSKFHGLNSTKWKSKTQSDTAQKVSAYGSGNPREFVAEVFLALVYGKNFDPDVIAMYLGLGGMPVGAARAAPVVDDPVADEQEADDENIQWTENPLFEDESEGVEWTQNPLYTGGGRERR